jgi:hypothetical protein
MQIPEHGFLSASGDRWQCERGYRAADNTCLAVHVPANAYVTDSAYGAGWACERGYRPAGETCARVQVPMNGYFVDTTYGRGWACERGFAATGDACVAIDLPPNAHLDYSGNDWDCNRPYRKRAASCVIP